MVIILAVGIFEKSFFLSQPGPIRPVWVFIFTIIFVTGKLSIFSRAL